MRRYAPALNLETAFISFIPVAQESSLLTSPNGRGTALESGQWHYTQ
jgi:hypothetical protein